MLDLAALDKRFVIRASERPATEEELDRLRVFAHSVGADLPGDYLDLLRQANEIEIAVGQRGYIRFWSSAGVADLNGAHHLQEYIPDAIAVGDDEGGKVFVFMNGRNGRGLYRTSFADPDPDEAIHIAPSLTALLERGQGIDRLFAWEQ